MTSTPPATAPLPTSDESDDSGSGAAWLRIGAIVVAAMIVGAIIYGVSSAAFSGSTSTRGNVATGTVAMTNNVEASTLMNIAGLTGGQAFTSCVVVTYTGDIVPAPVRLFGGTTGSLDQYLDMKIESGSGKTATPGDTSCTGFTADPTPIYNGTLATFLANHKDFATSRDTTWSAAAKNEAKSFRFTFTVQDTNAAQGKTSAPVFTWETRPPGS